MRDLMAGLFLILLLAAPLSADQTGDFSLRGLDGTIYTSAALMGTPLVVNIGSHW